MSEPQLLSAWAGHWTGDGTGVTVILPPPGTVASGEVRGGAPATREFALLEPHRLVDRVDAVVLSGGSAFGLAAGDGVMRLLRERGDGLATPFGPVPIVVGMSIFDGSVAGEPPGAAEGRAAALAALSGEDLRWGTVGAGAGAHSGKWRGGLAPGGIGTAERAVTTGGTSTGGTSTGGTSTGGTSTGGATDSGTTVRVAAVAVVNPWGDVLGVDGRPLFAADGGGEIAAPVFGRGNTTIAVLITNARLSKTDCFLLAQSGHTGFARAVHPAHSRYDGDAVVALATGEAGETDLDLLRATASEVMADAIRAAVS
ncbi:P1 family peptidase [Actinoplanes rectilineatus]|uniref:P1 family peptidase n=1 Tax=Actinoplanes rectilineatus TaxID=113571 RepID=UPI0005F2DA94|nr:P1 family peptidase [Actinoplanes rectilineatus]